MYSHVDAIEVSIITDDDLLEIAGRYAIGSAESILSEIKSVFK